MLAAQPGEDLLSGVFQVVGALVVDHHGQYESFFHTIYILCKAMTLILTTVCVKSVGVKAKGPVLHVIRYYLIFLKEKSPYFVQLKSNYIVKCLLFN